MNLEEFKKWVETEMVESQQSMKWHEENIGIDSKGALYDRARHYALYHVYKKLKEVEV